MVKRRQYLRFECRMEDERTFHDCLRQETIMYKVREEMRKGDYLIPITDTFSQSFKALSALQHRNQNFSVFSKNKTLISKSNVSV